MARPRTRLPVPPEPTRPPRTVYLIGTPTLPWAILRATLLALPDVQLVGEASQAEAALAAIPSQNPQVILSASTLAGQSALPVLAAVRAHCPHSTLVVFATSFTPAELRALAALEVAGTLLWPELDATTFQHCLAALLSGTVRISSRALAPPEAGTPPAAAPLLSREEQAVLSGLARDLTRAEIAQATGCSLRTVERLLARLSEKLDAATPFALGMKAAQWGLLAPAAATAADARSSAPAEQPAPPAPGYAPLLGVRVSLAGSYRAGGAGGPQART